MKIAGLFLTFVGSLLPVLVAVLVIHQLVGLLGLFGVLAAIWGISLIKYNDEKFFVVAGIFVLIVGVLIAVSVFFHGVVALWAMIFLCFFPIIIES